MSAKQLIHTIESFLNKALDNVYFSTALKVFLAMYAAFAAPQLPPAILQLFDTVWMRIIVAFIIIFLSVRDPSIAIMVAIAFIVTLQLANKYRLIDTSLSVAAPHQTSWLPSAKSAPQEAIPLLPHHANKSSEDVQVMMDSNPSFKLQESVVEPMGSKIVEDSAFTSQAQFLDAQSNQVPGADQQSCVQTWTSQQCIQGIGSEIIGNEAGANFSSF